MWGDLSPPLSQLCGAGPALPRRDRRRDPRGSPDPDAGCGRTMEYARLLALRTRGAIALDYSRERAPLDAGAKILPIVGDLANISLANESVGTIVTRSVLEHLEHPESVFREFARVLAPGARRRDGAELLRLRVDRLPASRPTRSTRGSFRRWSATRKRTCFPLFIARTPARACGSSRPRAVSRSCGSRRSASTPYT